MPYTIRAATVDDCAVILRHRRRMFEDMGYRDPDTLDVMAASAEPWLRRGLTDGSYRGWLVESARGVVVAGGGVVSVDFQPHPASPGPRRSWIVNMYTEPEHRRHGLARRIARTILDACRAAGLPAVFLHASDEGRPLYESLGFRPTTEMKLDLA